MRYLFRLPRLPFRPRAKLFRLSFVCQVRPGKIKRGENK